MRRLLLLQRRGAPSFCAAQPALPKAIKSLADFDPYAYQHMLLQLDSVRTEEHVVQAVADWRHDLNEEGLRLLTDAMIDKYIVPGSDFASTCAPVIAHYLSLMNKDNSYSFGYIVQNLAFVGPKSEVLWTAICDTFERETMEQFVPVVLLNRLFVHLAAWRAPPARLMRRIFPELVKFAARLPEEEMQLLQQTLHDDGDRLAALVDFTPQVALGSAGSQAADPQPALFGS